MKNHTLMQTIARANRVHKDKHNGLIVDYVGVFRNLEKALAIYGSSSGGGVKDGECPIEKKEELIEEYNKGLDVDGFFAKLTDFVKELSAEDQRGVSVPSHVIVLPSEKSNATIIVSGRGWSLSCRIVIS